jgi:phosphate starvation-inducible PhoH-like protein
MKMFLTRIGFGSKAVVTGDMTQVDIPGGRSGLVGLEAVLRGVPDLAFVHLKAQDVVRHKIVADIVSAYDRSTDGPNANEPAVDEPVVGGPTGIRRIGNGSTASGSGGGEA